LKKNILVIGNERNDVIKDLVKKLPEELRYRRNKAFLLIKG
jgi:hypothetical protein